MAFQDKQPFFSFLQNFASGTEQEVKAVAENYILDERVPDEREDKFLAYNDFPAGRIPADVEKVRGGFLPPQLKSSEELEKQTKGNHPEWKMKQALSLGK
jgi:hypothetical protein